MNTLTITRTESLIRKYYPEKEEAFTYYYTHVNAVAKLALEVARHNPALNADEELIWQMAMIHDIGIRFTQAPAIGCHGYLPYIAHGYKGREIMEAEGFNIVAPICERHIGTGITCEEIITLGLPLPQRDMMPITVEEEIVCYADKFFSKSAESLTTPKQIEKIEKGLKKYGEHKVERFRMMATKFGTYYIFQ